MTYPSLFVEYCSTLAIKLTALRKDVLYILWRAEKPLKAYEILENLLITKPNATPPSVYRALIFFLAGGIVHKIESIQSYTLCCEPEKQLWTEVLMVCNECHRVIEVYDEAIQHLVANLANLHHFELKQDAIELKGRCHWCFSSS
jgi:Fur family zinc uptake transcriptional regulator